MRASCATSGCASSAASSRRVIGCRPRRCCWRNTKSVVRCCARGGPATPEELLEPDLASPRRIAEATGNDLLAYIGNMLSLALRESIKLSSKHPNTHELSLPRHRAILTALMNRDSLGAQQATLVQLAETREDLSAIFQSGLDAGPAVAQRAAR